MCVNYALAELDLAPVTPERTAKSIGLSLEGTLEFLTGQTKRSAQQEFRRLFLEEADRVMVAHTELIQDVRPTLDTLRGNGLTLGVVSTKYRYRIEAILARHEIREFFSTIVGGEDTRSHKPDPEGIRIALKSLGLGESEVVFVGDHVVDADAADRASVPFVGVLSGSTTADEFRRFPHLGVLRDVTELPLLLSNLPKWPPTMGGDSQ